MKQLTTFVLALLLLIPQSYAQAQAENPPKPYIEVLGYADKKVVPDEIYVAINIIERESGKDKITVEQQEADLRQALIELNIPIENLSVSDAQADYIRVKWSKKDVVSQSEYELKLANAQQVAEVFDKLDQLKIDNAYISKVSHSKIKEYRIEVETAAIKAAKTKADYLLAAIGQETGPALVINERASNMSGTYIDGILMNKTGNSAGLFSERAETDSYKGSIQFRKIKLETTIYVKFEVKP